MAGGVGRGEGGGVCIVALVRSDYSTEMCSGSEAGVYFRRIDFVFHSTLGLRIIKKKREV